MNAARRIQLGRVNKSQQFAFKTQKSDLRPAHAKKLREFTANFLKRAVPCEQHLLERFQTIHERTTFAHPCCFKKHSRARPEGNGHARNTVGRNICEMEKLRTTAASKVN